MSSEWINLVDYLAIYLFPIFHCCLSYFWWVLSAGYKYGLAFCVSISVCTNTHSCLQFISLIHLSSAPNAHVITLFSIVGISGTSGKQEKNLFDLADSLS